MSDNGRYDNWELTAECATPTFCTLYCCQSYCGDRTHLLLPDEPVVPAETEPSE